MEIAEKYSGLCNVTYFKHAQERTDAGTAKNFREASRQIPAETGGSEKAVENRVYWSKKELPHVEEKTTEFANAQETSEKPKIRN